MKRGKDGNELPETTEQKERSGEGGDQSNPIGIVMELIMKERVANVPLEPHRTFHQPASEEVYIGQAPGMV